MCLCVYTIKCIEKCIKVISNILSSLLIFGLLVTIIQPITVKAEEAINQIQIQTETLTTYGLGGAIFGIIVGASDNLGDNVIDIDISGNDYTGSDVVKDIITSY